MAEQRTERQRFTRDLRINARRPIGRTPEQTARHNAICEQVRAEVATRFSITAESAAEVLRWQEARIAELESQP